MALAHMPRPWRSADCGTSLSPLLHTLPHRHWGGHSIPAFVHMFCYPQEVQNGISLPFTLFGLQLLSVLRDDCHRQAPNAGSCDAAPVSCCLLWWLPPGLLLHSHASTDVLLVEQQTAEGPSCLVLLVLLPWRSERSICRSLLLGRGAVQAVNLKLPSHHCCLPITVFCAASNLQRCNPAQPP